MSEKKTNRFIAIKMKNGKYETHTSKNWRNKDDSGLGKNEEEISGKIRVRFLNFKVFVNQLFY